jgi:hypothetical protein
LRGATLRSARCSTPAGGPDEFLERYAVILCSDHGQTDVEQSVQLQTSFSDVPGALVTASTARG